MKKVIVVLFGMLVLALAGARIMDTKVYPEGFYAPTYDQNRPRGPVPIPTPVIEQIDRQLPLIAAQKKETPIKRPTPKPGGSPAAVAAQKKEGGLLPCPPFCKSNTGFAAMSAGSRLRSHE